MTIQQLTYFRVLAETRHMGRAAEKLFLAQSSLSSAVAKLESELGVLLFERRGHHLVLTAEGTALLAHAETVLREVEETTEPGLHHPAAAGVFSGDDAPLPAGPRQRGDQL